MYNINIIHHNINNIYQNINNIHHNIYFLYNNIKKDIYILKNQNYILEKKIFNLNKQLITLKNDNNMIIKQNSKFKNFFMHNNNYNNNLQYIRAIPVINYHNIDNNIILYIESLKNDNNYLNKQNILLKHKLNI